jgi:hypothetical protein
VEVAAKLSQAVDSLPDRRFQIVRNADGMTVVTDYAHHPTEMACAVGMAREICPGTLRVLFQPHRYSRTKALLKSFPAAFEAADETVICPTYAAFEKAMEGADAADLYACCRQFAPEKKFHLARSVDEAWTHARLSMREGDVTLILGAGDIVSVLPRVRSWEEPPKIRHWIGAGSNTWKSSLRTGEEYTHTKGRAGMPGSALGIPWMAGIPGTVGGWIRMNAGAFGHSISEVLSRVKIDGVWKDASQCGFGYRTSAIAGEIQDFELIPSAEGAAWAEDAGEYLARRPKFPPGTKGSVFKNPPNLSAGRLLEAAGCKELRVGGACVWHGHANVIVSGEGSSPDDFLALAQIMRRRVQMRFGVVLEPEVRGLA